MKGACVPKQEASLLGVWTKVGHREQGGRFRREKTVSGAEPPHRWIC